LFDKTTPTLQAAASSGAKQIYDFLYCCIGTMVGGLKPAIGLMFVVRLMMEAAVGEGSTQPFVKAEEHEGDLHAFARDAVGIAAMRYATFNAAQPNTADERYLGAA
jgi:hypothetical protein